MAVEAATQAERIYRRLKGDILGGRLEPGEPLQFARLRTDYGSSVGVLREALVRLTAEGLTVNQAQHGFKVISLSLEDLKDLTATRCHIESMVLKDSVVHGDIDWESRVISAHHRMERTPKDDPEGDAPVSEAWAWAHQEFHEALLSAACNQRLKAIAASLRASAEVYRRWSMPFEVTKRDVSAEHARLVKLCLAHDGEGAAAALVKHLRLTETLIVKGVGRRC